MLSMPRGTDPLMLFAAREFAKIEFADHRYVMVLHDHQANPHVHLSVKAESKHGQRLNPRKADLHRWRETFAERLRERGIDAEATRQVAGGTIATGTSSGGSRPGKKGGCGFAGGRQQSATPFSPAVKQRLMRGGRSRPLWRTPRVARIGSWQVRSPRL